MVDASERAVFALDDCADLPITRHGHTALLSRMIALREHVTAYDAAYVALAERLDAALLTADQRLSRTVADHTTVRIAG